MNSSVTSLAVNPLIHAVLVSIIREDRDATRAEQEKIIKAIIAK